MKLITILFSVFLFATGNNIDAVSWDTTDYDFGEIKENVPATATYKLTNNSDLPLLIKNVKVGCGCTSSNYSTEAILPGETTTIEAIYNAKKVGKFNKTASVFTNLSKEPTVLHLKGEVVAI